MYLFHRRASFDKFEKESEKHYYTKKEKKRREKR